MLGQLPLLLQSFSEQIQLLGFTVFETSLNFLTILLLIACVLLLGPHCIYYSVEELPVFNVTQPWFGRLGSEDFSHPPWQSKTPVGLSSPFPYKWQYLCCTIIPIIGE